jgi:hypothetical protein
MWLELAAIAAPYIIGATQKKPKAPGMFRQEAMPNRDVYNQQLLDAAFNPDSNQYRMASDVVQEQVNRALARQGLAGSSPGIQLGATAQAQLATSWADEQLRRQQAALQAVNQSDFQRASMANQNAQTAYEVAANQYKDQLARQQGAAQGVGALFGGLSNIYGQQQQNQLMDQRRAEDRSFMMDLYGRAGAQPSYGTPGPGYNIQPGQMYSPYGYGY